MRKTLFALTATLCCAVQSFSQPIPQRVKTSAASNISADVEGNTVNGKLVFNTGNYKDLYVTDGTDQGTQPLRKGIYPYGLTQMGNKLFFIAKDSVHNYELWTTDGTTAGTQMVKDINTTGSAFLAHGYTGQLIPMNGMMYFIADDGTNGINGNQLWKSDGTAAGTQKVTDANGDPVYTEPFGTGWGVVSGGRLYFTGADSLHGLELWQSDGTAAGTHFLADLLPGIFGSEPGGFFAYNNRFCFNALDSGYGGHVFISDGTPGGTYDLTGGAAVILNHIVFNDTALFFSDFPSGLWRTDGTVAGTAFVMSFDHWNGLFSSPFYPTEFNNKLYFAANLFPPGGPVQRGIWCMDNAASTPQLFFKSNKVTNLKVVGNKLYFKSNDSAYAGFWMTDGTVAGTQSIAPPNAIYSSDVIKNQMIMYGGIYTLGNQIYYTMLYDITVGIELYRIGMFPASVPQLAQPEGVKLYPNPAHSAIAISGAEVSSVAIYNVAGILVTQKTTGNIIDINDLVPGQYFMHISTRDNKQVTERFVKY